MKNLTVKKTIEINSPAERVWGIITNHESWDKWMLVLPEYQGSGPLKLKERIYWKDDEGKPYLTGTIISLVPNKSLVFELNDVSWIRKPKPGEVTYALLLNEENGKTLMEFHLGDLSIDPQAQQWHEAYNASNELGAIKELAENIKN